MPESALKQQITEAMKDAMRAKDKARLGTIRLALSEIKRVEVDERIELSDERVTSILDKMVKQRRESIKQFELADRDELVAQEKFEIDVLQEFLPQALSEEELDKIIAGALSESGAQGMQDMGKVMSKVMQIASGKSDGNIVQQIVKKRLSG